VKKLSLRHIKLATGLIKESGYKLKKLNDQKLKLQKDRTTIYFHLKN